MKNIQNKFQKINSLIRFGPCNEAYREINELENSKDLSLNEILETKSLKLKYFNQLAQYKDVLSLSRQIFNNQNVEINEFYTLIFNIEQLKAFEALNKIEEAYSSIRHLNSLLEIFRKSTDRNYQLNLANYYCIIGGIYQKDYKYEQALKNLDKGLEIFKILSEPFGMAEILYRKGIIYYLIKQFVESERFIDKSLEIMAPYNPNMSTAWALAYKAMTSYYQGKYEKIPPLISQSLEISNKFQNIHCVDFAMTILSLYHFMNGNINECNTLLKKALELRKIRGNNIEVAYTLSQLANIYQIQGKYEKAENSLNEAFQFPEVAKDVLANALLLNIKGISLAERSKYTLAKKQLKLALELFYKTPSMTQRLNCFHYLISIALLTNNNEEAKEYLKQIEYYHQKQPNNRYFSQFLILEQGIINKNTNDTYKIEKAKEQFRKLVIHSKTMPRIQVEAMIHLIELKINELKMVKDITLLVPLRKITLSLLSIAKVQKKKTLISELFLLQAKMEILNLNLKKSDIFFNQSLKYAKLVGLELLIMKISYEYDQFLKLASITNESTTINSKITENLKSFNFEFVFSKMTRNLQINIPNVIEIPIFLVIWNQKEKKLLEILFIEKENEIFNEIHTNILPHILVIKEKFLSNDEKNRLKIDKFTIIEQKYNSLNIDYCFLGYSYNASKNLDKFLQILKNDTNFNLYSINLKEKEISEDLKELINKNAIEFFNNSTKMKQ